MNIKLFSKFLPVLIVSLICIFLFTACVPDREKAEINYENYSVNDELNIALVQEGELPYIAVSYKITNKSSKERSYKYSCKVYKEATNLIVCTGTSIRITIQKGETKSLACILYPTSEWINQGNTNLLSSDIVDCKIKLTQIIIDGIII